MLTFLILVSTLASALLLTTASRASDPDARPPVTVIVQPHDSLWSIAARSSSGRSPRDVVAEIRRLNGLGGDVIHPGERLLVPRGE